MPLNEQNRKAAHAEAKKRGVRRGALYLDVGDARHGPVACGRHRLHPDREITRYLRDADGRVTRWNEPDVHQTGQELADGAERSGYPGYQPDCGECADQVWDTLDHVRMVEADRMRS